MGERSLELRNVGNCMPHDTEQGTSSSTIAPELQTTGREFTSPPADTGKDAWLFLAACWITEILTFGFGLSFGVFQDFYSTHEPFKDSDLIAVVGTTTSAVMYLATPLCVAVCRRYPRSVRWFTFLGLITASLSMVISSFCSSIPPLIATQGVIFGFASCVACASCTLYIDGWFDRRKALAYGIVWSAGGVGGVILPLSLERLLSHFGFQTAMRIWACILLASSVPLGYFVKPRIPRQQVPPDQHFSLRFLTTKSFLLHQFANSVQAITYFLPGIYLPTYARVIFGSTNFLGTLTVMLVNISSTIGIVFMGYMSDKISLTIRITYAGVGASASVLLIWGLTESLSLLYVFCILYGLSGGSWTSTWPSVMKEVSQKGDEDGFGPTDPVMVHGHLCIGRGVACVISGFLSDALIKGQPGKGQYFAAYGSGYGFLILFTGLTSLVYGATFVGRLFKKPQP
ncbi:putative Major facilitator superfamily (MFS) profile domain-containing protein [Seiridium cardinale]